MKKIVSLILASTCAMFMAGCASSAQTASKGGFETVTTPATELENYKADLEKKDIPSGIGIAVSNDEMVARSQAADEARAALAVSVKTQVSRYKEQYGKNIDGKALKIWEEKANEYTHETLEGATIAKTITQFNEQTGEYKIYILVVMDPAKTNEAIKKAMESDAEVKKEFELRAESADMQKRMDAAAAAYQAEFKK